MTSKARTSIALLALALCAAGAYGADPLPTTKLPIPCAGAACGANTNNVPFVSSGQAGSVVNGATLTINQQSNKAILNWQDFNIGKDASVIFKQPGANAAALNRIWQGDPSLIQGTLKANGQIFLINQNGIVFDRGSQVNVGSLVASTLDISDQLFDQGFLSGIKDFTLVPAFESFLGPDGTVLSGSIVVNDGAGISADQAGNGRIMLFGSNVQNNGLIRAPDGQVVLAAGEKVYLLASRDPNLRGLFVEVANPSLADATGSATRSASNLPLGKIVAERGNVSLVGLAVNQEGRVSATTAVNANGSIRLLARDTPSSVEFDGPNPSAFSTPLRAGSLTLGKDSVTEVLPDLASKATIDSSAAFNPSSVQLAGRTVLHQGKIVVPGGSVSIIAEDPSAPSTTKVFLAKGSVIDVAGTTSTVLLMERNQLEVELRGDELKDFPVQRDGFLRGKKITIDIARGTTLADVSKQVAAIPRTVGEKTAEGGSISINSGNELLVESDALLDVSGGQIAYRSGFIETSKLLDADGRSYDVSNASPDRTYVGFANVIERASPVWGVTQTYKSAASRQFVEAYTEGKNAGSLSLIAPTLRLDGSLRAHTTAAVTQREVGKIPLGGALSIGGAGANQSPDAITLALSKTVSALRFDAPALEDRRLTLAPSELTEAGFSRVSLFSDGEIRLPPEVSWQLAPGGALALRANSVDIAGAISAPGGSVAMTSVQTTVGAEPRLVGDVLIRGGARIATRGLWVNDAPELGVENPSDPVAINGGSITLRSGGDLLLGDLDANGNLNPAALDVSGGAWLDSKGQLRKGNGGSLTLELTQATPEQALNVLRLGATVRGFAPGRGGRLRLAAGEVLIRDGNAVQHSPIDKIFAAEDLAATQQLVLPAWMFSAWGFSTYDVTDTRAGLEVADGTAMRLEAPYLQLGTAAGFAQTGRDIYEFAQLASLPELRTPTSLALTHRFFRRSDAADFVLRIGEGASIQAADPRASISATSSTSIYVGGSLSAPAGNIALTTESGSEFLFPFAPEAAIWLGAQARLEAPGAFVPRGNALGLRQGDVLPGGSINIRANEAFVVAERGSVVNVSGISSELDYPLLSARPLTISSDGGSIAVTAAGGLLFDGQVQASAAGSARGGTLSFNLTRAGLTRSPETEPTFPNLERVLRISADATDSVPPGLVFGDPIQRELANDLSGLGTVPLATITGSGASRLRLAADQAVELAQVALTMPHEIVLDSPVVRVDGEASLIAPFVTLGSSFSRVDPLYQPNPLAVTGPGKLTVSAHDIDLIGNLAFQGVGERADALTLDAQSDLRARGVRSPSLVPDADSTQDELRGGLTAAGDIVLRAAQIYPSTASSYQIKSDTGSIIALRSSVNKDEEAILSAGGQLKLDAKVVRNEGVLKAPSGSIELVGSEAVVLEPGSVTSVSQQGALIPYGRTQNSLEWSVDLGLLNRLVGAPPAKSIATSAPSVEIKAGARVDISGGGDLYAYEFVPGPGGSRDVLSASATNSFAVLPSLGGTIAPYDPQYHLDSSLQAGASFTLGSGGAGLAAATYTVLPARYALLPGAFLVTPTGGFQDLRPGQSVRRLDGVDIVAGYRGTLNTAFRDARWSGFAIEPGAAARKRAEYRDSFANAFFTAQALRLDEAVARLPRDAGRLASAATQSLVFEGEFATQAGTGGRGGLVDISAQKIRVVDAKGAPDDFVQLSVADLQNLSAESLFIGGTRERTATGERLTIGTERLELDTRGAVLKAQEIWLGAGDLLEIKSGSIVEGAGTLTRADAQASLRDSFDGSTGAVLRAASGAPLELTRSGTVDPTRGTLIVESGAELRAAGALLLDASADVRSQGALQLQSGGALSIGAGLVSLGEVENVSSGLVLTNEQLAGFQGLRSVRLRSYSSIDFWGNAQLSGNEITLDAPALFGFNNAGKRAVISADKFLLENTVGAYVPSDTVGSGALAIDAREIVIGAGSKAIQGFDQVSFAARGEILLSGQGDLAAPGSLNLQAHRIGGLSGAVQTLQSGDMTIAALARPEGFVPTQGLGAQLTFAGTNITSEGYIDAPAGSIELRAEGARGVLRLAPTSVTSAAGATRVFDGVPVHLAAGKVQLLSPQGSVEVQAGALIDVSAAGDATSGTLNVSAPNGSARLDGSLLAASTAPGRSGRFTLDALSINGNTGGVQDLAVLNALLNTGQFDRARTLRLRSGDVLLPTASELRAQSVRLVADAGRVDIQGTIRASAAKGGVINISARDQVRLHAGGVLDASGAAAGDAAGRVALATTRGDIALEGGGSIKLGDSAAPGELWLRAPRTRSAGSAADDEVGIGALAANLQGVGRVVVEGFRVYNAVDATDIATWQADTDAYMQNTSAILARLGSPGAPVVLRPGIEIQSAGDFVLASNWDLSTWRYDGQPGVLTIRAARNLDLGVPAFSSPLARPNIQAILNDGFDGTAADAPLQSAESWSYRLAAGADLGGADTMGLLQLYQLADNGEVGAGNVSAGNVRVAASRVVRTGTGSIDIAAGRDFVLGNDSNAASTSLAAAAVYTAGRATGNADFPALLGNVDDPADDFPLPANANYPTGGGNVSISAQQDVQGAITHQLITGWLLRRGRVGNDGTLQERNNTSWHIDFGRFRQNVGTLGGGDVAVQAGRDVLNLSVVAPTTGRLGGAVGSLPQAENLVVLGGGDIRVDAGRDIKSGVYYVARGIGTLSAGGSIAAGRSALDTGGDQDVPIHTVLALADGRFELSANRDLTLETILNPSVITQGSPRPVLFNEKTLFFTYSDRAAVQATSLSSDIVFNNNVFALVRSAAPRGIGASARDGIQELNDEASAFTVYAPTLAAHAIEGSIRQARGTAYLFASPQGNLSLLAGKDVDLAASGGIRMLDLSPDTFPNPLQTPKEGPVNYGQLVGNRVTSDVQAHASPILHAQDFGPNRIVAREGDVLGKFELPKATRLVAGRDITNLTFIGQNVRAGDVTSLIAGRDVTFPVVRAGGSVTSSGEVSLGGPGRLEVVAGRNVDLGSSKGLLTEGRRNNPALPEGGASITVAAGLSGQQDYAAFIRKYIDPSAQLAPSDFKDAPKLAEASRELLKLATQDPVEQRRIDALSDEEALQSLRQSWLQSSGKQLLGFMRAFTGDAALSEAQALEQFKALNPEQQRPLILDVFYDQLKEGGRGFSKVGESAYARGFDAVGTLFPGSAYQGDVTLLLSQIKTQAGGDINLLVPGGRVNAGQTTASGDFGGGKSAAELGLIVEDFGSIRSFTDGNFDVNESRVVTLRGGSIVMWSSKGDIDAGRGAKTAAAAPAPQLLIDNDGGTTFRVTSFSGSGIRSFLLEEGITPGDVDLIAPAGEVNAGDAGIGAAGNLNIAALRVIGADNIQVGGVSSGVPSADVGGIGAGLTGLSNVASEAAKSAEQATAQAVSAAGQADALSKTALPSFITVEVIEEDEEPEEVKKRRKQTQ